ncbi:acetylornithine deacetylase/succinyl-diaminopimelate desuccinylase-like protein [Devosia subaequoris]|uniref:Acetylornithine deacetylase/succinyl-diaminopimelate desuccinylase-like protein n=1 Tax=Devosia subaequoris TaxID=395930 RepID=A0A7W6IMQ7_9HYPH|nr:M20/M25/M40 family metallo-hydrolase [Devosia subaequoris]MBB4052457.1 acetylornithine deacetylase/succinyl-diaminopimelate desuccinylase-like protein [Devosia subaequoris]MCP1209617.1 M20/M25/M40 family metallo-hydrolase [Devosia subaequoris]
MTSPATIDTVLAAVDSGLDQSLERLFHLLRIKSISTDPAYAGECRKAADWIAGELSGLGFDAASRPTPGHPVVVAHGPQQPGPHVLFYAHYDVQPVDPLNLWDTDPFEPVIREKDGRKIIVARGASDDKGQMLTFIEACRAWKAATGSLPVRVSLLLEGEEESGGTNLPPFMRENMEELKADIALVCDTDMWDRQTPSITTMLRGLVADEVEITAANKDLHSGMFGNAARNPNQVLAEIIASLRAPDGSVTLPGFYDDVAEIGPELKAQWAGLGFDEKGFLGGVGLSAPAGEQGRTVLEQLWARPTCEINGMSGGYIGDGFKTVIPARASAKISFRLVSGQDPAKIRAAFRTHVENMLPPDCSVRFTPHGGAPAITVPADGQFLHQALQGLSDEWDEQAVITGSGGSIPVVGEFKKILGLDTLLIGFAHVDDQIHSPNEKYDLESYHRGIRSWVRVLGALAQ